MFGGQGLVTFNDPYQIYVQEAMKNYKMKKLCLELPRYFYINPHHPSRKSNKLNKEIFLHYKLPKCVVLSMLLPPLSFFSAIHSFELSQGFSFKLTFMLSSSLGWCCQHDDWNPGQRKSMFIFLLNANNADKACRSRPSWLI